MADLETDWRLVDGVLTAWFDASSLTEAAALASRVVERAPGSLVGVRASGLRARVDADEDAEAVSAAALDLGLVADPSVLQQLSVVVAAKDPAVVGFWRRALAYEPAGAGALVDPLRRDPALWIRPAGESRRLRNRVHLDVVRPAAAVGAAELGEASGPYGVCHTDPDGNEVDLVPGGPLGEGGATADWTTVFGAMACYRVARGQEGELAVRAAEVADAAGFPLVIDLRPGLVILDSGKDQWDADAHGLDMDFAGLAAQLQAAARELGATADPELPRFVQLFWDAADVAAVRAFWLEALGYVADGREGVTDICDPRRLGPVLVFQPLDAADGERRRQRNRIHVELAVPPEAVPSRLATCSAAGGRLLDETDDRWRMVDPEGNELVLIVR